MSLREVTKAEFFAFMGPRNVNPHSFRNETEWCEGRVVIGKSKPGYITYDHETGRQIPKQWFIVEAANAR